MYIIYRNDSPIFTFRCTNKLTGLAYDLTGLSGKLFFAARENEDDATYLWNVAVTIVGDPTDGICKATVPKSDNTTAYDRVWAELSYYEAPAELTWIKFPLRIEKDVRRP